MAGFKNWNKLIDNIWIKKYPNAFIKNCFGKWALRINQLEVAVKMNSHVTENTSLDDIYWPPGVKNYCFEELSGMEIMADVLRYDFRLRPLRNFGPSSYIKLFEFLNLLGLKAEWRPEYKKPIKLRLEICPHCKKEFKFGTSELKIIEIPRC